ncbi:MAG TPA: hypothetical protein VKA07_05410 [Candidatus Sulfotelmatobacter sp.]|nr:hypothetical protein [Candidatus Sulfotelmatobacter sp.]
MNYSLISLPKPEFEVAAVNRLDSRFVVQSDCLYSCSGQLIGNLPETQNFRARKRVKPNQWAIWRTLSEEFELHRFTVLPLINGTSSREFLDVPEGALVG